MFQMNYFLDFVVLDRKMYHTLMHFNDFPKGNYCFRANTTILLCILFVDTPSSPIRHYGYQHRTHHACTQYHYYFIIVANRP